MSPTWSLVVTAVGLALSTVLLWRQHRTLTRLRWQVLHDDTTGLPNRRAVLATLTDALRHGRPVGVVLIDLDKFKQINDTHGHENGNDVLTEIGRRLQRLPDPVLLAARLSGDEYALLVRGGGDETAAAAHAAWHAITDHPVQIDNRVLSVGASVGHTIATTGATSRDLLTRADAAMYRAKVDGSAVQGATVCDTGLPSRSRHDGRGRHRRPPQQ